MMIQTTLNSKTTHDLFRGEWSWSSVSAAEEETGGRDKVKLTTMGDAAALKGWRRFTYKDGDVSGSQACCSFWANGTKFKMLCL